MSNLGCDYTGYEFGGGYIDSCCIDGYLWDLDSCDEPGGGLTHGGEWACPRCNTLQFLKDAHQEAIDGGCGNYMGRPHCAAVSWESSIAKARTEQPEATDTFLADLAPFFTDDWPDRDAVRNGRARWDVTIKRQWPWPISPYPEPTKSGASNV